MKRFDQAEGKLESLSYKVNKLESLSYSKQNNYAIRMAAKTRVLAESPGIF